MIGGESDVGGVDTRDDGVEAGDDAVVAQRQHRGGGEALRHRRDAERRGRRRRPTVLQRPGAAAHGQAAVDHHAPRQRRAGVLGPDVLGEGLQLVGDVVEGDHVCRWTTASASRRSSVDQSAGGEVGRTTSLVNPASTQRPTSSGRASRLGRHDVAGVADDAGRRRRHRRRALQGVRQVDPEVLVGDGPAGLVGGRLDRRPPGDGVVERDAAGQPPVPQAPDAGQGLGHLPAEPHLERFLGRAGVERQPVDLVTGPPAPDPGEVLVEPASCGRRRAGPGPPARPGR